MQIHTIQYLTENTSIRVWYATQKIFSKTNKMVNWFEFDDDLEITLQRERNKHYLFQSVDCLTALWHTRNERRCSRRIVVFSSFLNKFADTYETRHD